jgi:hypothetical protein
MDKTCTPDYIRHTLHSSNPFTTRSVASSLAELGWEYLTKDLGDCNGIDGTIDQGQNIHHTHRIHHPQGTAKPHTSMKTERDSVKDSSVEDSPLLSASSGYDCFNIARAISTAVCRPKQEVILFKTTLEYLFNQRIVQAEKWQVRMHTHTVNMHMSILVYELMVHVLTCLATAGSCTRT